MQQRLPVPNQGENNWCRLPLWDFSVGCEFALRHLRPSEPTRVAADSLKVGWRSAAASCNPA